MLAHGFTVDFPGGTHRHRDGDYKSKAADPRAFFPSRFRGRLSTDEGHTIETHRQSAKLARHHHPQQGRISRLGRERAEAVAIKQFALDDDQRSRLLIRERL
jgi:hypothetical protein